MVEENKVRKMTTTEELKYRWNSIKETVLGWTIIGLAAVTVSKLSYQLGYGRGVVDLADTLFTTLSSDHNS